MQPDFYNKFYDATSKSSIHSQFCKFAYGIDLCQHGFADKYQLDLIFQTTRIDSNAKILDLGCGNGSITEYLYSQKLAFYTGLDNNEVAIKQAKARTQNNNKHLTFIVGDINNLQLPDNSYDKILSIDTIYFSTNYDATLSRINSSLKSHGNLLIFYSIGPALLQTKEFPHYLLEPETTPLAESLKKNGFSFIHKNLTANDYKLANLRKEFLQNHKQDFYNEGIGFIYENRIADSMDFSQSINDGIQKRYLYCATKSNS